MLSEMEFLSGLDHARQHQEARLSSFLRSAQNSTFGREHGFSGIRSVDDFRRKVPLCCYEDLEHYIGRITAGEHNVLFDGAPYCFLSSSGSTTGRVKVLPMSKAYFTDIYNPFLQLYMSSIRRYRPAVARDWNACINFKWDPLQHTMTLANGARHVGVSQIDLGRGFQDNGLSEPGTNSRWSEVPADIDCPVERLYYRIRFAARDNIRQIVGINPAIIAALPDIISEHSDRLIEEVRAGLYRGEPVDEPDPVLARRLEELMAIDGRLLPRHLWPEMHSLLCWDQGIAGIYLPSTLELYGPGCEVVAAPLGASESPLAVNLPSQGLDNVLAYRSSFYEFIDVQDGRERPLLLDQLSAGAHYRVVVTHHSGLYRYLLGDIIKAGVYAGQAPKLTYMGRYNPDDSLPECLLVDAVSAAARGIGLPLRNFTFRQFNGATQLQVELILRTGHANPDCSAERLLAEVNRRLPHAAVSSLQIEPPGSFSASWLRRVRSGLRPPQVKDRVWNGL